MVAGAIAERIADQLRFIGGWLKNPLTVGSFIPSSKSLGQTIASLVEKGEEFPSQAMPVQKCVLELGPGTGVLTREILASGVSVERLMVLEYDAAFCKLLQRRHTDLTVIQGDAYALRNTLKEVPPGSLTSIVSGLPLLARPLQERQALVRDGLYFLKPGAPFIQFTYGLSCPIRPEEGVIEIKKAGWVFSNLPPACVWIFRSPKKNSSSESA